MERTESNKGFIVSGPLAGDIFVIHRERCPLAALSAGRTMNGKYNSPEEAAAESAAQGITILCPFCLKEKKLSEPGKYSTRYFSIIPELPETALFCGIN